MKNIEDNVIIVIAIVFILALSVTYNYLDKVEEQKFYDRAIRELTTGIEWKHLTDEDRAEIDLYRQRLIEQNSTKKGWGARWLDNTNIERLNNKVREEEATRDRKRYEGTLQD